MTSSQKPDSCKPTAIDLFCGCGGMGLGLHNAGFDVVFANDINGDALNTYRHNLPTKIVEEGDITKINPHKVLRKLNGKKIDIITAGTPCQGFSHAGPRNPNDPRNKLFLQLLKFVKVFKPKLFVMENVPGILTIENGKVIERIEKSFSEIGYYIQTKILSASEFGVPQERKRIFLIGTKEKIPPEKLFPNAKRKKVSTRDALSDLEFLGIGEKATIYKTKVKSRYQSRMRKNSRLVFNHESCNHNIKIQERFARVPHGENGHKVLQNSGTKKRDYYKLDPRKTSRTITTIPEDLIHYKKNRIPTVRELARLQSFPDDFQFLGPKMTGGKRRKYSCPQYTQVANAVPPLLAEKIFRKLHKILRTY